MMLEIFLDHFIGYLSCAPCTIADSPKVTAPILLAKRREFLLKKAGGTAFKLLHQITYTQGWRIFDMHMNMVLTHNALQNMYILRIAYLHQQIATAMLKVAR